jgi:geranylgeranyl pyrophosphate synthase
MDSVTLDRSKEFSELEQEIIEIGKRSRSRFKEIVLENVDHPEMISSVENVCNYWKDNIRPALIQYSCEAVGGSPNMVDSVALFFSIAGAGVGIHDDIIDKTIKKRDRVTISGAYGRDFALTIGDLLIVKGLTTISEALRESHSKETIIQVLEAYESFFTEMCVGEIMEIKARKNLDFSLEHYHDMLWKLGVDAEACTKIGAILGNGSAEEINCLSKIGRNIGYLNRIDNEIIDIFNLENGLLYRIENESIPLLMLYSSKKNKNNYNMIKNIIVKKEIKFKDLGTIWFLCISNKSIDYIKMITQNVYDDTLMQLQKIIDCAAQKKLELITWNINNNIHKKFEVRFFDELPSKSS